jgi:hypothetical protein
MIRRRTVPADFEVTSEIRAGPLDQPQLIHTSHLRPLTAPELKARNALIARASIAAITERYARFPTVVHLGA